MEFLKGKKPRKNFLILQNGKRPKKIQESKYRAIEIYYKNLGEFLDEKKRREHLNK